MKNGTSDILKELAEEISAMARPGPVLMSPSQKLEEAARIADLVDDIASKVADYQARLISECIDLTGLGSMAEADDHAEMVLIEAQEKFTTDIRKEVEAIRAYGDAHQHAAE